MGVTVVGLQIRFWSCVSVVVALVCLGCGTTETPTNATGTPTAKQALEDFPNLLNYLKSEGKNPPSRIENIVPIEPLFPGAYLGLVRGEIAYVWDTTIDPAGSSKVLAYEKAVETGSGWVLMQDGSLKTMTSAEFQSAPKATK
jgi:hypothetical protein